MTTPHPLVAWILGWLLPGAGHLYTGRRAQGIVLMAALVGCFAAGALLGRGGAVTGAHVEYLVLQSGAGLPAFVAWLFAAADTPDIPVALRETAVLYTVVPAMLNVVVAMDAAARAAGGRSPEERQAAARADSGTVPGDPATGEPATDADEGADDAAADAAADAADDIDDHDEDDSGKTPGEES